MISFVLNSKNYIFFFFKSAPCVVLCSVNKTHFDWSVTFWLFYTQDIRKGINIRKKVISSFSIIFWFSWLYLTPFLNITLMWEIWRSKATIFSLHTHSHKTCRARQCPIWVGCHLLVGREHGTSYPSQGCKKWGGGWGTQVSFPWSCHMLKPSRRVHLTDFPWLIKVTSNSFFWFSVGLNVLLWNLQLINQWIVS